MSRDELINKIIMQKSRQSNMAINKTVLGFVSNMDDFMLNINMSLSALSQN